MSSAGAFVRSLLTWWLLLLTSPAVVAADPPAMKAGVFEPARDAPDFTLTSSNGGELKLSQFRGKVVLLGFGFTSCPEVCPTTLAVLAQARRNLGAAANEVQVVYITVDPERDHVGQMKKYLATFDPGFIGGTGSPEALTAVRSDYGILAEKKSSGTNYSMAHSSFIYLIDRNGKLRALMPYGHPPADFVHDLKLLLRQ